MNKLPDIIYAIAALCSVIASILAWVAKIKWSKEFADAKDAALQAKDAEVKAKDAHIATLSSEIDSLKHLTPMKIREYFESVKAQLSEYNDSLQQQLGTANNEIQKKDSAIKELQAHGTQQSSTIDILQKQKLEMQKEMEALQQKAKALSDISGWHFPISSLDPDLFQGINESSKRLSDMFGKSVKDYSTQMAKISARFQDSIVTFPHGFTITPSGWIAPLPEAKKEKPKQGGDTNAKETK
jgi:predicted RNase H-like nuclease (RuvC/YqgF family)